MYKNKAIATILFLALLAVSGIGQGKSPSSLTPNKFKSFTEVKGLPSVTFASYFEFSTSGYHYKVLNSGKGIKKDGKIPPRSFNLRLDKEEVIERVLYYAEFEGDLLLTCETRSGDAGAGFIARLNGNTLALKWKRHIPAFNVGRGLVEGNYAYLTAMGFIAKVDLITGRYTWQHDNLYRSSDGAFNSFELPEIKNNKVVFRESPREAPSGRKQEMLLLDEKSGKIIGHGNL